MPRPWALATAPTRAIPQPRSPIRRRFGPEDLVPELEVEPGADERLAVGEANRVPDLLRLLVLGHGVALARLALHVHASAVAIDLQALARGAVDDGDVGKGTGVGNGRAASEQGGGEERKKFAHVDLLVVEGQVPS